MVFPIDVEKLIEKRGSEKSEFYDAKTENPQGKSEKNINEKIENNNNGGKSEKELMMMIALKLQFHVFLFDNNFVKTLYLLQKN